MQSFEGFFANRHSIKPTREDPESGYPGISEQGVEQSRAEAKKILDMIDRSPAGTVLFLGGASELARTKSTAHAYGDELRKLISEEERSDIIVLNQADVVAKNNDRQKQGYTTVVNALADQIANNPGVKFIIEAPLFLKEFGFGRWGAQDGSWSEFTRGIMERYKTSDEQVKGWIESGGELEMEKDGVARTVTGPNPTATAEEQLQGIGRLRDFAKKYVKDRPLIIGSVGHSWAIDALAAYLANGGKVDAAGFEKIGGTIVDTNEMARVEVGDEESKLYYKNQEFPIAKEQLAVLESER